MSYYIFSLFLTNLLRTIGQLTGQFLAAWLVTFVILVLLFRFVKAHLRPRILRIDDHVRAWAKGLRYREIEPEQFVERHALTLFMRFWTNFASAPSLSVFSLGIPLVVFAYRMLHTEAATIPREYGAWDQTRLWLLPGLCYAGSMYLSWTLKRVFKRLRPPREIGAFGYKLKDGSFPSGHSLTSFCFWFMITISLAAWGAAWPLVLAFSFLAALVIGCTGLSRIYLGVHFPSDVAGGFTIGLVWCLACFVALYPH